jgi:hypothetical protein
LKSVVSFRDQVAHWVTALPVGWVSINFDHWIKA